MSVHTVISVAALALALTACGSGGSGSGMLSGRGLVSDVPIGKPSAPSALARAFADVCLANAGNFAAMSSTARRLGWVEIGKADFPGWGFDADINKVLLEPEPHPYLQANRALYVARREGAIRIVAYLNLGHDKTGQAGTECTVYSLDEPHPVVLENVNATLGGAPHINKSWAQGAERFVKWWYTKGGVKNEAWLYRTPGNALRRWQGVSVNLTDRPLDVEALRKALSQ